MQLTLSSELHTRTHTHAHTHTPCRDDKVLAVCSLNSDPVVSKAAELMFQGKMPLGSQLK